MLSNNFEVPENMIYPHHSQPNSVYVCMYIIICMCVHMLVRVHTHTYMHTTIIVLTDKETSEPVGKILTLSVSEKNK